MEAFDQGYEVLNRKDLVETMDIQYVKDELAIIGFKPISGVSNIWEKKYFFSTDSYQILVEFGENLSTTYINYGNKILYDRRTSLNFSKQESIVVLECVDRLLRKQYLPETITLEKHWRTGGYLDIYVKNRQNIGYLMIECKTYGKAYNQAKEVLLTNSYRKEQLFNYYLNDQNVDFLLLYTSTIGTSGEIIYKNDIIDTRKLKGAATQLEVYNRWDKNFITKAVFENEILAYGAKNQSLKKADLDPLDSSVIRIDDKKGSIYNLFADILRRYAVSDKSNAYDKIFNLFLCKIVDEDNTMDSEELGFQWKDTDSPETVLVRLNDLYTQGMRQYLKLNIADITEEDFEEELNLLKIGSSNDLDISKLKEMFRELRLYRNTTFAFREIIDRKSFMENAEIVKAVVLLLQRYKIRYNHKQRFLSEFFERLLNIGIKQEVGQYFTPVPIADFICNSIDIETIINKKINDKCSDFLPYTIDFACGSGHFITSMMDRIDVCLRELDKTALKTIPQKENYRVWSDSYKWANSFMYGIEKDYRLAKTTKVASFLNGDGEAKIFYADGLDSFSSNDYSGRLHADDDTKQDNPCFDILVANPPYSVGDFKLVLPNANRDFNIAPAMTEKSDDIECLFVERMKQLLKTGGRAGIILPPAILYAGSHNQKARYIILTEFKIIAICELGKNTFASTDQKTIVLFLERRDPSEKEKVRKIIEKFIIEKRDFAYEGEENILSKFIKETKRFGSLEEYIHFLEKQSDSILEQEKKKLNMYLLCFGQDVILSHPGDSQESEKCYLGYEHSKMKNYEGIHAYPYREDGKIISPLYNPDNRDDENTISYLIRSNFNGKNFCISNQVGKYVEVKSLNTLISYADEVFSYKIYLQEFENPYSKLSFQFVSFGRLEQLGFLEILDSMRKPIKKSKRKKGNIPYYGANGISDYVDDFIFDEKLLLIGEDGARWGIGEKTSNVIEGKAWVNNHAHVIRVNEGKFRYEYLSILINRFDFSFLKNRPNGGKLLQSDLKKIEIPVLDVKCQDVLIERCSNNVHKLDELLTRFSQR